jgi:hypothetical protein
VLAALDRAMPLIDKAVLGLRFGLGPEPKARTVVRDAPKPGNGFLYPHRAAVDPIGAERAALATWPDYFAKLRTFPCPDRVADTKALIQKHPGTHVAWVAQRILDVLEGAPHDEDSSLDGRQWGCLADYYKQAGLWERAWAIGKAKKPRTYREYYPGMEVQR